MNFILRFWNDLKNIFEEEPPSEDPVYDPVHVAGVMVVSLAALGALFWLLWALLVCEGGIFVKVIPFLRVVFTSKTLQDFGFRGVPYDLGVFEGWIVNLAALIISIGVLAALWSLFRATDLKRKAKNPLG